MSDTDILVRYLNSTVMVLRDLQERSLLSLLSQQHIQIYSHV